MSLDETMPTYVLTWGANDAGQCMQAPKSAENCLQPGFIDILERRQVRQVFAGYDYSCVISNTERLFAAGNNEGGFLREEEDAESESTLSTPQMASFDELEATRLSAVSGGRDHIVAVTDAGAAISWGRNNEFGQVGHGPLGALRRQRPGAVSGLPQIYRVLAVSCGESSTLALLSSGELYSWGANDLGQLGLGDTEARAAPARVGGSATGVPFRAISSGMTHCLALSRSGRVYSWGNSRHGRLGIGGQGTEDDGTHCEPFPRLVPDVPLAKHVSGGGSHSAIIVPKGKLLMCGSNRHGQLGVPRTALAQRRVFAEVAHVSQGVRLVECGSRHTLCLTFDGSVVGFGSNSEGQLGIGRVSECEERPVTALLRQGEDARKLLVFALAVTMDHSCALALPFPERRDQLDRYVSEGSCLPRSSVRSAGGRLEFSPTFERTSSVGGLGRFGLCCGPSSSNVDHDDDEGGDCLARTVSLPANGIPRLSSKRSQPIAPIAEEEEEKEEEPLNMELPASLGNGVSTLPRNNSYIKFKMPSEDGSPAAHTDEVVLLKPLVQPGVASKAFLALSPGDLLEMLREARCSGHWREVTCALTATLRCPAVLNSSFHFLGSPRPLLDSEALFTAFELLAEAAPVDVHDAVLDAAEHGLEQLTVPEARGLPQTSEQLRSLLIYLLLPQLRNTKFVQRRRHAIMSQIVLHIAFMQPSDRRLLMDLIVEEMPQAFILKKAVVTAVRLFLNERVRLCSARAALDDPGLWHGTLLMQLLYLANEKLREDQRVELHLVGNDDQALRSRFLGPEEFHISALDDGTIPPHAALMQLLQVSTVGMGLLAPSAQLLPPPSELVFGKDAVADPKTTWLPQGCCVLLMHRNLVSVAYKQKVLQESNALLQHRLQEQTAGPHQLLAMLSGQALRPFLVLEVSREKIVEDVARFLRDTNAAALHLPLKVKFAGEDGQDEGGVRREFFQVLIRRLFDESYGMFAHDPDSHATWFSQNMLETEDTDELFKVCGTVIGLAVYNNEHGIEIHFPLALFKKLKGEALSLADLQDIKPKVWMSLQQLLSWQPSTADANQEFEDTFCLTFAASYDYFGETRTVDLKEGGSDIPVTFDTRGEYVDLYSQWLLEVAPARQYKLLAEGFEKVVDSALWSFLTAEEAHIIVCSEPTLVASDLRTRAHYEGFEAEDPYIQDFWKILESFDTEQLKKFLAFTTGTNRAPLNGLRDVRLIVQKHGVEPTQRLPTAQTCFNLLLLPRYENSAKMEQLLLLAIENTEGFGLQ